MLNKDYKIEHSISDILDDIESGEGFSYLDESEVLPIINIALGLWLMVASKSYDLDTVHTELVDLFSYFRDMEIDDPRIDREQIKKENDQLLAEFGPLNER